MHRPGLLAVLVLLSCSKDNAAPDAGARPTGAIDAAVDAPDLDAQAAAARARAREKARAELDAGTFKGPELYAAATRTSVMNVPAWPATDADGGALPSPDVYRLGYLRHGSHVPVLAAPIVNDDCHEGWYELVEGGYVCGKYASLDPKDPAVRFAAHPPDLSSPMPYRYGVALADETPVYRRVLSHHDRIRYEPWLAPPDPRKLDGGVADGGAPDEDAGEEEEADGKSKDAGAPDAAPIKLRDLRGHGVLAHRIMKGFYVGLDRDFHAAKAHWWRTTEGFAIPYERIMLQKWTPPFHGAWVRATGADLDGGLPEAGAIEGNGTAVLVHTTYAMRYRDDDKGHLKPYGRPMPKWSALELAGDPRMVGGVAFQQTTAGFWVRVTDMKVAHAQVPDDLGPGEKSINVDLGDEVLVAFEGKHPVFATLVSSGKRTPWDPIHDHPTPTGTFHIYEKHVSATMDGDVAATGPYSIEDVPWVMYFQGSYALHGAFWHNYFGSPFSHGCVNLSPTDARELFFWTEPRLPVGWHGVFQTAQNPGTRVVIHGPPEKKK